MTTSLLNSKKCSRVKTAAFLALFVSSLSLAAEAPSARLLASEINSNRDNSFSPLLEDWGNSYGTTAVKPLLSIATSHNYTDRQRYIAIMGAAKLGGQAVANQVVALLKDGSWMIRSGALKAMAALKDKKTAPSALSLIKDPALVVRAQAIETTGALRPPGAAQALLQAIQNKDNYHGGKAQWIPQRALQALADLNDASVVPQLRPLLDHKNDPDLQRAAIATLEHLTGDIVDHDLSLNAQVASWKKNLTQRSVASSTQPKAAN
jgi:HEAT repeat protein